MSILQEFKDFAVQGNAVDMAVGIIAGAAFGNIISSLVADVFMPPIGLVIGGVDFSDLAVTLKEATENGPAVTVNYGKFIQSIVDFTMIAFVIFMFVRVINNLRKNQEAAPVAAAEPTKEELLLTEIRDLLKEKKQ